MRNRYLDLLRAAAIVRVIVYHLYGWPWLSIVLPAMGVMFALAGSLTAASLDKRAAGEVVTSRLRRLLPPLWLLGLVAVPVMLVTGWAQETDNAHPFSVPRLLFWLVPIGDPPGSDQALDAWEPLWYIRAYLWFVLLSPVLYALYRKAGWAAVALPLLIMAVLDVTGIGFPETADAALWDFVTYGACWIAGFAHHDGRLARVRPWIAAPIALALAAGAYYFLRDAGTYDLNDVSESQALWSLAFVLIALRWQPPMGWLPRVKPLDHAVTLVNNRAVTIYLWHNIAIAAVWPVLTFLALDDLGDRMGEAGDLLTALALTALAVLAFGWVEDLAAKRRPRLWPTSNAPRDRTHATTATAAPGTGTGTAGGTTARGGTQGGGRQGGSTQGAGAPGSGAGTTEPATTMLAVPGAESRAARISGTVSALAGRTLPRKQSAAAAMHRLPADWPPIPRDATTPEPAQQPAEATPQPASPPQAGPGQQTTPLPQADPGQQTAPPRPTAPEPRSGTAPETPGPAAADGPGDSGLPVAGRRADGGDPGARPTLPDGFGVSREARESGPEDATEWFSTRHRTD
ncbi:acyltransferase family protein [Paractinoplanes deccanensis]|uniref:acyltransferase family protein n=1 Tax=Paractinoplanes deccanensis TaxID=113561 RepID=UPI001EF259D1|nr:acyltransferase [Actinoplanes deccanensis]